MSKLFRIKPVATILQESQEKGSLKRSLTLFSIVSLGVGAIIGAGLFVRTAAAAGGHAGPSVALSFLVAALGCLFAGLCYSEFASMLPLSGSAYTYSYSTMGEMVAWIIGWDLVLEYALGAATVSIGWSQYLNEVLRDFFKMQIQFEWCHPPMEGGIINLPAIFILFALSLLLIRGISESAMVNNIIVLIKLTIISMVILLGWKFINFDNFTPLFIPEDAGSITLSTNLVHNYADTWNHGFLGMIRGSGIVFFAFIGFDAISTAAQEAKNPSKDLPKGIIFSLLICTLLYVLFSLVLTGTANYKEFMLDGKEASVAYVIKNYMPGYAWLSSLISVAILAGFSSVILVMLLGQTRVFYAVSKDGLLPPLFSKLHPKYRTPYLSQILLFFFTSILAGFLPDSIVGDMSSIGTLFAFVLVCIGVMIMRKTNPDLPRPFKTPYYKVVATLGILVCMTMIVGLGVENWTRLIVWLLIGFIIYFTYGIKNSKLNKIPKAPRNIIVE